MKKFIFSLFCVIFICSCSACQNANNIKLTKMDEPVYERGDLYRYELVFDDLFSDSYTDLIFEGRYLGSEFYQLIYSETVIIDNEGNTGIEEFTQYYTIFKFEIIEKIAGDFDKSFIYVALRNLINYENDIEYMEFEKDRTYIILAREIEKYAGRFVPINKNNFPASHITTTDTFVFLTDENEAYVTSAVAEADGNEKSMYPVTTIDTNAGRAERYVMNKGVFIEKLIEAYNNNVSSTEPR